MGGRTANGGSNSKAAAAGPARSVPPLSIRLLGAFSLKRGDVPLPPLRTRKGASLLALLALRRGQPLSRDLAAETLWPDSPPELALANLRRSLTDLRQTLGPDADRLTAPTPRTLQLDLDGTDCDLLVFGAADPTRDDTEALEAALAAYGGPLLAGSQAEWLLPERQELAAHRLFLLETLAERRAREGDGAAAERLLSQALAQDPGREAACRALMRLLAARGDLTGVLRIFHGLRQYLHREWNAAPSPETTALFKRLRASSTEKVTAAASGTGEGDRRPPLPRPLTRLIGREDDLRRVASFLNSARLITLTGAGGVGKTRLALAAAEAAADIFPDGVAFAPLADITDPTLLPQALLAALGESAAAAPLPAKEALLARLRGAALLLVLDNCEHLAAGCAELAQSLLFACRDLRLLLTSRQPLGIPGERVWRVPSLSLPPRYDGHGTDAAADTPDKDAPSALLDHAATQLFLERASWTEPAFRPSPQDAPTIAQICRRLDGIPLAIELAAARVTALTVTQIAARLDDCFRLLADESLAAAPRQRTLRAALDWSYDLLSPAERFLLRRLSVFTGGWTLEAAEAVASDAGLLSLLTSLVDKSLVVFEAHGTAGRYRFLETVRQYAAEREASDGEAQRAAVRRRHAAYYARSAREMTDGAQWDLLEADAENIRAALGWLAATAGAGTDGLDLAISLAPWWEESGRFDEGRRWLTLLLADAAEDTPVALRARGHYRLGLLCACQDDSAAAKECYRDALSALETVAPDAGQEALTAGVLHQLGVALFHIGDLPAAETRTREALARYRALGAGASGGAAALTNLGHIARKRGDWDAADALYEEAATQCRREAGGGGRGLAYILRSQAHLARDRGDYARAQSLYAESLALWRRLGSRWGVASLLGWMGRLTLAQGDMAEATRLCTESLALFRELRDITGQREALEAFILLFRAQHRDDLADTLTAALAGERAAPPASAALAPPLSDDVAPLPRRPPRLEQMVSLVLRVAEEEAGAVTQPQDPA